MTVQVQGKIPVHGLATCKRKISRQPDRFNIGFCQSLFEIPYSTDISRGY
jgi:hypothetical protein